MNTLLLAQFEPGSFWWYVARDGWSLIWTIACIAALGAILHLIYVYLRHEMYRTIDFSKLEPPSIVLGCALILCVLFPLLSCHDEEGCGPWLDDEERAALLIATAEKELEKEFYAEHAEEYHMALEELDLIEAEWTPRVRKLGNLLRGIGRDPSSDENYRLWLERLEQLDRDREQLNETWDDAFVAYATFKLALSAVSETHYNDALDNGLAVAEKLRARWGTLQEEKEQFKDHR